MQTKLIILTMLCGIITGCNKGYISDRCLHDNYIIASVNDTEETKRAIYKHNKSLQVICDD